jgi:sugar phosphate isomerase/epimerase
MAAPISIQLYTVRELVAKDYAGIVTKIAEMGYVGVEPAGFPGTTVGEAVKLFKKLGLKVSSAHAPLPVGDKAKETLDVMAQLGCKYLVSGFGPDQFKTVDGIKASCDQFNAASKVCVQHGLNFAIHNHWWEFLEVDGKRAYKYMLEFLDPQVKFEIDTYWVQTGGACPAEVVKELGARAPLLHIKDGPCNKDLPMTAVGEGKVDFPAVVKAAGKHTEWMIVELDRCATDMMEAVQKSYTYLTSKGLARGNK